MKIKEIKLKKIFDSRKEETFEIEMSSENFSVFSSVGKGKSRGSQEVTLISSKEAPLKLESVKELILKEDFSGLKEFDQFLLSLDKTPQKQNLGGNLTLTLSVAFAKLMAKEKGLPLFVFLREEFLKNFPELKEEFKSFECPYLLFNFINGGPHAEVGPDFQEYLIIPFSRDPSFSLNLAEIFFAGLKEWFRKNNLKINYGDEGGLIYPEKDNEAPLKIFSIILKDLNLNYQKIRFGIDVAASTFLKDKDKESFLKLYRFLIKKYHLFYLEDPFPEDDFLSFSRLNKEFQKKVLICGDDLTVTNPFLIEKAIKENSINSVIIKPTQIGTLLETFQAIYTALKGGLKVIISHRSGETEDDFLADLAVAVNAFGLKSGALVQKERMVKYLRIKKISEILKK